MHTEVIVAAKVLLYVDKIKMYKIKFGLFQVKAMLTTEIYTCCIIKRYCEKRFVAKYLATIGIDYGVTR